MGIIFDADIFRLEIIEIFNFWIQPNGRRVMGRAGELFLQFLLVTVIDVRDIHIEDVLPQFVTGHLCNHTLQDIVLGNIERQTYLLFPQAR